MSDKKEIAKPRKKSKPNQGQGLSPVLHPAYCRKIERRINMIYNKNNFLIHALCDKDGRDEVTGIHLTSKFTEVTNGRLLLQIETPKVDLNELPESTNPIMKFKDEVEKESLCDFVLHQDNAKEIEKTIPKKASYPILQNTWLGVNTNKEQVEFVSNNLGITSSRITQKPQIQYFKTENVFPDKEVKISVGFNPELMMKFCQVLKKIGVKTIKMDIRNDTTALEFFGVIPETDQSVRGLLMPKKLKGDTK